MRSALRAFSTVLIAAGVLLLMDAGLTLAWQEPVSALYARLTQDALGGDLEDLQDSGLTDLEKRVVGRLPDQRRRLAFLGRSLKPYVAESNGVWSLSGKTYQRAA